ncbi:MAG: hypothetical protein IJE77_09380, partial [Thermoguttaceae bacterium]|nr:hypothetical protein [Thermoguttaceae bacterium]
RHSVAVELAAVGGNSVAAQKYFFVGDAPTTPRYTLRDDGATLIDGVPFFPIGIYGVSPYPSNGFDLNRAFADLKAAGFNFAQSYFDGRTDAFLAAAEKHDFKLWVGVDGPDERLLDVERHSPAILAWYVGDDTAMYYTPEELRDRSDSLRAVDPIRLSTQADVVSAPEVSNYLLYADGTDSFLPEIYPFRRDEPEWGERSVAATLRDMRISRRDAALAGDGPKAIWPILQSFKGWGWTRFPTFRELNATSFAALGAGAKLAELRKLRKPGSLGKLNDRLETNRLPSNGSRRANAPRVATDRDRFKRSGTRPARRPVGRFAPENFGRRNYRCRRQRVPGTGRSPFRLLRDRAERRSNPRRTPLRRRRKGDARRRFPRRPLRRIRRPRLPLARPGDARRRVKTSATEKTPRSFAFAAFSPSFSPPILSLLIYIDKIAVLPRSRFRRSALKSAF